MKKSLLLATLFAIPLLSQGRGPVPGLTTSSPYLIYYGNWDAAKVESARTDYKLVILHPVSNITPGDVATIQKGPDNLAGTDDDVRVLAYISVGEDDRTLAPVAGDGAGPRVDPRAADDEPLSSVSPLGDPSPGGGGWASYYLDDGDLDGEPDRNSTFGGAFVNPGDPAWYQVIKNNVKSIDGAAGLDEILTSSVGLGYGCDGVFLDTLDTPAPNSFGATLYEWTAPAYQELVKTISEAYPDKLLLGNRGVFFYNPNLKTYAYTLRPHLNLILFESYYTDSSGSGEPSAFFDDNKFNYAPKVNAEAARVDGFTVLGLGYTSTGEPDELGENDFIENQAEQGWPLYRTDPALNSPFNTDAAAWNAENLDDSPPVWDSTEAFGPDFDLGTPGNQPPPPRVGIQEVEPGESIATVRWDVARDQTGPVTYNIYYTDEPTLDFPTASKLTAVDPEVPDSYRQGFVSSTTFASEFVVTGLSNGTEYLFAVRAEDGLSNEESNTVTLAATPMGIPSDYREIAIDGDFADWEGAAVLYSDPVDEDSEPDFADVSISNDADFLYVRFTLHDPFDMFVDFNSHVFIDTDNNATTGHVTAGSTMGSDFMVESGVGYDERAGGFNDGPTSGVQWSIFENDLNEPLEYELRISRAALYLGNEALGLEAGPVFTGDTIRVLLQHNSADDIPGDITAPAGILYRFAPSPPPPSYFATIVVDGLTDDWDSIPEILTDPEGDGVPDIVSVKAANDDDCLYLLVEYASPTDTNNFNGSPSLFLSLDNDNDTTTGYDIYGLGTVGAEVSWQNDFVFGQDTDVWNTGATFVDAIPAIAPFASNTMVQEYCVPRNATFTGGESIFPNEIIRLALWSDGSPAEVAGGFTYAFATEPGSDPYGDWKEQHFDEAQLADPAISGDEADPDLDGLVNLVEFGLAGDPLSFDSGPLVGTTLVEQDSYLTLTYTQRSDDAALVTPESSSDLSGWDADPSQFVTISTTPTGEGIEEVVIRSAEPIPTGPNFVRLNVQLN